MVKVIEERSCYTVEITPRALGGEATIIGMGFAMNIPEDTPVKISSAKFYLKHEPIFNTYYLHWNWMLNAAKKVQGDGNGNCCITEADFLELKKHFQVCS